MNPDSVFPLLSFLNVERRRWRAILVKYLFLSLESTLPYLRNSNLRHNSVPKTPHSKKITFYLANMTELLSTDPPDSSLCAHHNPRNLLHQPLHPIPLLLHLLTQDCFNKNSTRRYCVAGKQYQLPMFMRQWANGAIFYEHHDGQTKADVSRDFAQPSKKSWLLLRHCIWQQCQFYWILDLHHAVRKWLISTSTTFCPQSKIERRPEANWNKKCYNWTKYLL